MRKFVVLAALLTFGAGASPAAAQTFGFGAHAGVSLPMGDYSEGTDLGFLGGLDLVYPLTMLGGGLGWYSSVDAIAHGVDDDDVDSGYFFVPVMTGLRLAVPAGPVSAFLTGQVGAIFSKAPSIEVPGSEDVDSKIGTTFGFNIGGGVHVTDNVYAGVKYYPLGDVEFEYEEAGVTLGGETDVSFLDVYVGFGVF